jgi:hypothetical protein
MRGLPLVVLMVASLAGAPLANAASACHAASSAHSRPLVELYTSEGCDSCPPAEQWLSSQFDAAGEHSEAIALAFHVDYWDRLGWADRFAKAEYTARQYDAMRANGASFVYTPQVLLQGRDSGTRRNAITAAIDAASRTPARASIALDVVPGEHDLAVDVDARVADAAPLRDAQLFVAYADSGLVSDVKAGENRGVRLTHDHVVRTLRVAGTPNRDGRLRATLRIPRPDERGVHPMLVAFLERGSNGDVLQALALPLDACASK